MYLNNCIKNIKTNKPELKEEQIEISDEASDYIAELADGGLRDALGYLDQLSKESTKITVKTIQECFGLIGNDTIENIFKFLNNSELDEIINIFNNLFIYNPLKIKFILPFPYIFFKQPYINKYIVAYILKLNFILF